ncbi:hypothetical protein BKA82DRAFT_4015547 [Pisolithus tinctorius]|nr:hypothetical protein BKA82DRAFT_4015547 [Pisolithus tinctorius]
MPVPVSGLVLNLVTSDLTHAGNHTLTHTGHPVVLNHGEHELQSHWKKKVWHLLKASWLELTLGLIGCKFKGVDVQEDLKHWLSAEELSSMVLTKMHETAEQFLDKKVNTHDLYHINIDPWNTWLITYQKEPSPLGVSEFVRGGSDHGWDNHWQEQ